MGLNSQGALRNRIFSTLKREKEAVANLAQSTPDILKVVSILSKRPGKIIVTGVGKSAFIGMKMAATFTSLGHYASFLHPVDALHGDSGIVTDGDVIVAISFSGDSPEVLKALGHLKKTFSVQVVAITGNIKSSLYKLSEASVVIKVKDEGSPKGLAPMASTTASLVVGDLLAAGIVDPRKFKEIHFAKFHPGGSLGLRLRQVEEVMASSKAVPKILPDDPFKKAILEINKKRKGVVGVVDRFERLVGVITDGDVRRFFAKHESSVNVLVKNVMTRTPKVIFPHDSLEKALQIMENAKITNLFVITKGGKVVGLIHIHDIIEVTT